MLLLMVLRCTKRSMLFGSIEFEVEPFQAPLSHLPPSTSNPKLKHVHFINNLRSCRHSYSNGHQIGDV